MAASVSDRVAKVGSCGRSGSAAVMPLMPLARTAAVASGRSFERSARSFVTTSCICIWNWSMVLVNWTSDSSYCSGLITAAPLELRAEGGRWLISGVPTILPLTAGCPPDRGVEGRPSGPTGAMPCGSVAEPGVEGRLPPEEPGRFIEPLHDAAAWPVPGREDALAGREAFGDPMAGTAERIPIWRLYSSISSSVGMKSEVSPSTSKWELPPRLSHSLSGSVTSSSSR
mmetsp:Transcript_28489/g.80396  ORF Transcript_28489/g.80396 Transcript_28489/m.80396 type:complete len:228 (-) Transcript_28489:629-1312(-)